MMIKISSLFIKSIQESLQKRGRESFFPGRSTMQNVGTYILTVLVIFSPQTSLSGTQNNICKDPLTYSQELFENNERREKELLQKELLEVFPSWNLERRAKFLGKTYQGSPLAAEVLEKITSPMEAYSTSEEQEIAVAKSWSFFTAEAKNCTDIQCLYMDLFQNEEAVQHALVLGIKYKIYLGMHPDNSVDGLRPRWTLHGLRLILKSVRALPSFVYNYSSLKKIVEVSPDQAKTFYDYNLRRQQTYAQSIKQPLTDADNEKIVKDLAGLCTNFPPYDQLGQRHLIHIMIQNPSHANNPDVVLNNMRSLYHEFGHALEKEMELSNYLDGQKALSEYRNTIKNDPSCEKSYVSDYAKESSVEDFAETFMLALLPGNQKTDGQCKIQSMQAHILKNYRASIETTSIATIVAKETPLLQWIQKNIGCRAIAQFCAKKSMVFLPPNDPQPHIKVIDENYGYKLKDIAQYTNCFEKVLNNHIFPFIPQCGAPSKIVVKSVESELRKTCQNDIQSAFDVLVQQFQMKPPSVETKPNLESSAKPLF